MVDAVLARLKNAGVDVDNEKMGERKVGDVGKGYIKRLGPMGRAACDRSRKKNQLLPCHTDCRSRKTRENKNKTLCT